MLLTLQLLLLLLLCTLLRLTNGFNHNPKLYVDANCIEMVDPLRHGFDVLIPEAVANSYLDPYQLPLIYATAVSLEGKGPSIRKMAYIEDVPHKRVRLEGLDEKTWYYICIEFENMHRHKRQGNTSTTCQLHRTLDEFGKRTDSVISDISITRITETSLEFQVEVAAEFQVLIDFYLEQGSVPVQTYYASSPKSLRVVFSNLMPGFNYGRLCSHERPLLQTYTSLGRSIHVIKALCQFTDLQTLASAIEDIPAEAMVRTYRNADSAGICSFSHISSVVMLIILIVLL